jgi:hypothetical protein
MTFLKWFKKKEVCILFDRKHVGHKGNAPRVKAWLSTNPECCGRGRNRAEAIGAMITSFPEVFKIDNIKYFTDEECVPHD